MLAQHADVSYLVSRRPDWLTMETIQGVIGLRLSVFCGDASTKLAHKGTGEMLDGRQHQGLRGIGQLRFAIRSGSIVSQSGENGGISHWAMDHDLEGRELGEPEWLTIGNQNGSPSTKSTHKDCNPLNCQQFQFQAKGYQIGSLWDQIGSQCYQRGSQ